MAKKPRRKWRAWDYLWSGGVLGVVGALIIRSAATSDAQEFDPDVGHYVDASHSGAYLVGGGLLAVAVVMLLIGAILKANEAQRD